MRTERAGRRGNSICAFRKREGCKETNILYTHSLQRAREKTAKPFACGHDDRKSGEKAGKREGSGASLPLETVSVLRRRAGDSGPEGLHQIGISLVADVYHANQQLIANLAHVTGTESCIQLGLDGLSSVSRTNLAKRKCLLRLLMAGYIISTISSGTMTISYTRIATASASASK